MSSDKHFLDEDFENEIPGGFDNIDSNENSIIEDSDDGDCYIKFPALELHIGPDWEDIEISSDCEENKMLM